MKTLPEYIKSLDDVQLQAFADRAGTTLGYLNLLRYGKKRIGPEFALTLEKASNFELNAEQLCPNFPWHEAGSRSKIERPVCLA